MSEHHETEQEQVQTPRFADTPENGVVMRYLTALEGRNIDAVVELFSPAGVVYSPMYGKMPARAFYTEFFKNSSKTQVTLLGLLGRGETISGGTTTGYWAHLSNLLATGAQHEFDLVAVMELEGDRISAFHIVMDTALIRPTFDRDMGHASGKRCPD